ncbi:hypothetical protein ANCCEY_00123 [Ancylostoma ceylanicum]|uniref:C-type lectin domain-containing protein n=1 Tax=Ancylostoma ceylanicum TaxID=53326 RepID=A0A0D6MDI4_9BILA|nr:hypothetical protein ANCCEY_00123 [Ancylostoma ceylanicum]
MDGTEMDFTKWSNGAPKKDWNGELCGQMYTTGVLHHADGNTYWNDVRCNRTMRYFVCKTMMILEKL